MLYCEIEDRMVLFLLQRRIQYFDSYNCENGLKIELKILF